MTQPEKDALSKYGKYKAYAMAQDIASGLTGKGLSLEQAEALLSLTKDLLCKSQI